MGRGLCQYLRRLAISSAGTSRREFAVGDVEGDGVAFVDGGDGASELGFGGYVAGHEAAGGSGEAAVGEEGYGFGEFGDAFDGGGDGEHLAHAGASARAFVADDEDVGGVDLAGFDGGEAVVFAVEDAGGAWWKRRSWPATLMTQPSGARLPLRMTRPPVGLRGLSSVWMTGWPGVSTAAAASSARVLRGDGDLVAVEEASVEEALGEEAGAACVLVVLGDVLAAGGEVADEGVRAR